MQTPKLRLAGALTGAAMGLALAAYGRRRRRAGTPDTTVPVVAASTLVGAGVTLPGWRGLMAAAGGAILLSHAEEYYRHGRLRDNGWTPGCEAVLAGWGVGLVGMARLVARCVSRRTSART